MQYNAEFDVCVYDMPDVARAHQLINCMPNVPGDIGPCTNYIAGKLIVPCELPHMQVMAALGHEAMSPIMVDYDWPIMPGRQPLEHQKHMASFMTLFPRCFNLSDMGTMKTMATLWAWDYLMKIGQVKKVMIVCTISCMADVWAREIALNLLGRRKAVIVHGTRKQRVEALKTEADFYIINHDGLDIGSSHAEGTENKPGRFIPGALAEYLRANPDINGVTVDEGAEFRHQSTDTYKSLKYALRDKPYFNWLTGTPTPKDPTDAYAQAKMVRVDYHENFTSFRERTMYKLSTFKWKAKREGYDVAATILKPAIRYGIKDCQNLPPVIKLDREAPLSPAQAAAIKQLKGELKTMVQGGKVNAINEASLRTKLLQIACGAVYGESKQILKVDCAPRLAVVYEAIEQSKTKVIVFAPFTSVVDMLHSELNKDYKFERITGDVSPSRRAEIFRNLREDDSLRGIVADAGTMAHGLDLTVADMWIWYAPVDNPGIYQQANKRVDRPGQKNTMSMVRIASTAAEREIYRRLESCESLQGAMLDLIKGE